MNSNHEPGVSAPIQQALKTLHGMRIALIAPAGGVRDERIDAVLRVLGHAGVDAIPGGHIRDHHRYLAGTAAARLADLHAAFARPDIDAVWCLRGGYGSAHLIDGIDWGAIPDHVPLIGHSDITALASAFAARGKPAIHGPVAVDLLKPCQTQQQAENLARSIASLATCLRSTRQVMRIDTAPPGAWGAGDQLSGRLVGGNLTTLASICDLRLTPADDAPRILLLEDVGEAEFRLERCFHQLVRSALFSHVKAIVLGEFMDCRLENGTHSLITLMKEHLNPGISLLTGAPVGHGFSNQAWRYDDIARLERSAEITNKTHLLISTNHS